MVKEEHKSEYTQKEPSHISFSIAAVTITTNLDLKQHTFILQFLDQVQDESHLTGPDIKMSPGLHFFLETLGDHLFFFFANI